MIRRGPVEAARLRVFELPRSPASIDEAFDAVGATMFGALGAQALADSVEVFVTVLRDRTLELWRLRGLPRSSVPEDDLVRAVVWTSEVPADTVVVAHRFEGFDPRGREAVGIRYFHERAGERAWAVLRFHEVGSPPPAEVELTKAYLGPPRPGRAWLGVPPVPRAGSTFDA